MEISEIDDLLSAKVILDWEEIDDYPDWEEVEIYGIPLDDQESILLPYLFQLLDKLAGWPKWIKFIEYPNCPTCNQQMNQLIF